MTLSDKDTHRGMINKHAVVVVLDEIREASRMARTFSNNVSVIERCDYIADRAYKVAELTGCRAELEEIASRRIN